VAHRGEPALGLAQDLDADLQVIAAQDREAIAPLHAHHTVATPAEIVEPDLVELCALLDAIEIGVIQRHGATVIFIDQREGRAGHAHLGRDRQAARQALDEQGLARTQIADQADQVAGAQAARQGCAGALSVVRAPARVITSLCHARERYAKVPRLARVTGPAGRRSGWAPDCSAPSIRYVHWMAASDLVGPAESVTSRKFSLNPVSGHCQNVTEAKVIP
jgi:hypothetical protein